MPASFCSQKSTVYIKYMKYICKFHSSEWLFYVCKHGFMNEREPLTMWPSPSGQEHYTKLITPVGATSPTEHYMYVPQILPLSDHWQRNHPSQPSDNKWLQVQNTKSVIRTVRWHLLQLKRVYRGGFNHISEKTQNTIVCVQTFLLPGTERHANKISMSQCSSKWM